MPNTITLKLPKLHEKQREMRDTQKRFNIACMGRRFGKTTLGLDLLIDGDKSILNGYPVAWFAPTYKLLDEVWRDAKNLLKPLITRTDTQQKRMEFVTGGVLDFWSLDGGDPARGRKYANCVLDEAAMVPRLLDVWNLAIRPTLADYEGQAWFMSTPKGQNDFYELWQKATNDNEWARFNAPTSANPFIKQSEIDAMQSEMPELQFRQEIMAEFVTMSGTLCKSDWLKYMPMPSPQQLVQITMGVDLAISTKEEADFTAIAVLGKLRDGETVILDVFRFKGSFHQQQQEIKRMAAKWSPRIIAIETVQYQAAVVQELMRTTSLPVIGVTPDKDKVTRMLPVLSRYEHGHLYHAQGLNNDYEAELLAFPYGKHDDMVDAVAHAFAKLNQPASSFASAGDARRF